MLRSLSTTLVRPGSESESEDREHVYPDRTEKNFCCTTLSMKHAAAGAGVISSCQVIGNFYIFLAGCGVTMVDIVLAIVPVIFGFIAIGFLIYSLIHNFGYSMRPFIVYQVAALVFICVISILFVYCYLLLHNLRIPYSTHMINTKMYIYLESLSTIQRIAFAAFLLINFTASVVCLHTAMTCYNHLENYMKYVSADVTEV